MRREKGNGYRSLHGWVSITSSLIKGEFSTDASVLCYCSFLFGTCCLLSGDVETSLANEKPSTSDDKIATKAPVYMSSKPTIINNQFYGANTDDNSLYEDSKFEVSSHAVKVTSSAYADEMSSAYYPTESSKTTQHATSHNEGYSTELPTRIYTSTASSVEDETNDAFNSIQFSKVPYDHSGIAYSPSDAEVGMEDSNDNMINQYPMSTPATLFTETRTEANKFSKPIFKLKPTSSYTSSTEKYVLVHTISNDKQNEQHENPTKKPSTTNESIQSIILMLNGSNPGPEYTVDANGNYNSVASSTSSYDSTSMIDREQYGSSSYYITTKSPSYRPTTSNVPSTSYVYSPNPTRRQTTKTTITKNPNRVKVTPTRSPEKATTLNVPSTSYIYSPNPITKRPGTTAASATTSIKKQTTNAVKKTTPRPTLIVKRPVVDNNYVVISGGGITKHPSPTVHITPKPITNILTSSTLSQLNNKLATKRPPSNDSPTPESVTERPSFVSISSTPSEFVSSSIYVPAIQDFHNEGYFVVTHRPGAVVSSTSVYTINNGIVNQVSSSYGNEPVNFNVEVPLQGNDDFSNFPPVRNPNLNMTASVIDESEISTPAFVEDDQLNSKIDLLVSKLVASMQGNVDNLVDIVYERKNATTLDQNNKKKNGTLQDTKPSKAPNTKVTTKAPTRVTTGRPSQTTKKNPTKATSTSKKPSTGSKKPTAKPSAASQTTKKPANRVTTTATTRKPTRKVTTTSTTERAPSEDEIIEEEGEETAEETDEEVEEESATEESENEGTFPPLESGKIRKQHFP